MNYTELKANIKDICENEFTEDQLAMFTQQAEQKIYLTVDLPVQRKNTSGVTTTNNRFLGLPADFLYAYSVAVITAGNYQYLLNKDPNFVFEAYPDPTDTGRPQHYGIYQNNAFILGPTPDAVYQIEFNYSAYPTSIVDVGSTYLGDEFDSALLNGALMEAIRFMKGEPDLIAQYEKFYVQAVALLKNVSDGKLRQDMYRSGQPKIKAS
jgi:hypothetical protein